MRNLTTAVIVLVLLAVALPANAQRITTPQKLEANYNLTTDFIESDRKCRDDLTMCVRVQRLCEFMTETRVRELRDYIRNEYPFKAKNGGMNITTRFNNAYRKCR